jgi:hypothetical protein
MVTHMVVGVAHPKVVTTHQEVGVFHLVKKVVQLMKMASRKTSRSTNMPPKGAMDESPWEPLVPKPYQHNVEHYSYSKIIIPYHLKLKD